MSLDFALCILRDDREQPVDIELDEWLAVVRRHADLREVGRVKGVNPLTQAPLWIPAKGLAVWTGHPQFPGEDSGVHFELLFGAVFCRFDDEFIRAKADRLASELGARVGTEDATDVYHRLRDRRHRR
jgi:hypothetical protein